MVVVVSTKIVVFFNIGTVIERADNRASVVFGLGFGMAMLMLMPMVLVGCMMAAIWVYEALGGDGLDALRVSAVVAGLIFIVFAVLVYWDRAKGETDQRLTGRVLCDVGTSPIPDEISHR